MKILVEQIAKTAYAACVAVGVYSEKPWEVAEHDDKNDAIETVILLLDNPEMEAEGIYLNWLSCMKKSFMRTEWEFLSEEEKIPYKVFFAVVDSLRLSAVR